MRNPTLIALSRTGLSLLFSFYALSCTFAVQAQNKPASSPPPQTVTMNLEAKNTPFDEAVARLFEAYSDSGDVHRFRIDPTVTAYLDPVTYTIQDASLETALSTLLSSLKELKTPLTYRIEKEVYVITPNHAAPTSETGITPLGLPSYHPTPSVKRVSVVNAHLGAALQSLFEAAGVNYVFMQPFGVTAAPRTTFAIHNMPMEQAVVHLLRSMPTEPLLYLQRKEIMEEPGKFIYVVSPSTSPIHNPFGDKARRMSLVDYRYSFHLQNANLFEILKVILAGEHHNYTLDPNLRKQRITVSGTDLNLEDALAKVVAAASIPLMVHLDQDIYSVIPK